MVKYLVAALLILQSVAGICQITDATDTSGISRVLGQFNQVPALKAATWSFSLLNPKGSAIMSRHSEQALIPASTLKIMVTTAALDVMGPDYRFYTKLAYTGSIQDGTLEGDLWIIGGGDPSLGSGRGSLGGPDSVIEIWIQACQKAGIKKINGAVYGDGQLFGAADIPGGWPWDDIGNYYAPVLNALTLNENRLRFQFNTPAQVGQLSTIQSVVPNIPGLTIQNQVYSGPSGSGDETFVYTAPGSRQVLVRGTLPAGRTQYPVTGAFPDPEWAIALQLVEALKSKGIPVSRNGLSAANTERPENLKELVSITSPPLKELVQWTNELSLNGYAETFLRMLGTRSPSNPKPYAKVSVPSGLSFINNWLINRPNLSKADWNLNDGSGLSLRNTVTSASMTKLLYWTQSQSWSADFMASLPKSGQSGTMTRIAPQAPGRIVAKSGSLDGVKAYAGFVKGKSGSWYPFCILVNHAEGSGVAVRQALSPLFDALLTLP